MVDTEKIKITMLGTSQSGKTCYMLGMYANMKVGLRGFTLSTKDSNLDIRMSKNWKRLFFEKGENRWPPPSDVTDAEIDYSFYMNYGFRPIIEFQWIDYRGGALSDDDPNLEDIEKLRNFIKESSCLFLCISGEYLKSREDMMTVVYQTEIDRMSQYLSEVYTTKGATTVAILITKYDLCMERDKEEIIEDIKYLFQGLFAPDAGWLVMICPMSLGKELAIDINEGKIQPINVHLPVAFAVYSKLTQMVLSRKAKVEENKAKIQQLSQEIDDLGDNWFKQLWNKGEIHSRSDKIRQNEQESEQNLKQIEKLQSDMIRLAKEVPEGYVYLNGTEVEINV